MINSLYKTIDYNNLFEKLNLCKTMNEFFHNVNFEIEGFEYH